MSCSRSGEEPLWVPWQRLCRGRIPLHIHSWLGEQGSLTKRVIGACDGRFRVRLLSQSWGQPLLSERRGLAMAARERALVRQVLLLCDEVPWVYARTIIPASHLHGKTRRLGRLKERPLGAVLFASRGVRHGEMEVARLLDGHRLYSAAAAQLATSPPALWGRRRLYSYGGKTLLVNEIFLPPLVEMTGERP